MSDDFDIKDALLESDDLFDDSKDLDSNVENATQWVEENLQLDKGLWVLASWSRFHGGAAALGNVRYFQQQYPGIVVTRGSSTFGAVEAGIPEERLADVDQGTIMRLESDMRALQESPILDEGFYSEALVEAQDKAWDGWIKSQFMRALNASYPQFEDRLWELTAEEERSLFETLRDHAGAEWTEESDGDQTVNLDDIYDSINEDILREYLFPPGSQLQLDFGNIEESIVELLEAREFSCVLAPAPPDLRDYVLRWGQMFVTDDQVYDDSANDYGRENDPHVTVKFGLHEELPSEALLKIIEQTAPFEIEVGQASFFESEKYDVLKFDVTGDGLYALNQRISEAIQCTDTHPEYHAHMTVAYVQKGCCRDLEGRLLRETGHPAELRFLVKTVTFSSKNGNKYTLFLGKPNENIEGTGPVKEALSRRSFMRMLGGAAGAAALAGPAALVGKSTAGSLPDSCWKCGAPGTHGMPPMGRFCSRCWTKFWADLGELPPDHPESIKKAKDEFDTLKHKLDTGHSRSRFDYAGSSEDSGYALYQESAPVVEAQGGTVVIHLADRTTDFLKPIYDGMGYPVVSGGITREELAKVMESADRLYMMGHGSPHGLFGDGYLIGDDFGPILAKKQDGVYIWCNADAFAARHGLNGLVSGMFISEVGEASYFGLKVSQEEVDASNDAFARIVREVIDRGDPYSAIRDCYAASNAACKITQFNAERLYVFQAGQATPALHKSSAYHEEVAFKERGAQREAWRKKANEGESILYRLRDQLAAAAQQEYDAWEQDEEGMDAELGPGGLCQNIAAAMADVLSANNIEVTTVDTSVGDQHVWVMALVGDVVFSVDIPPHIYETGSGYVWKKRQGVTFEPADVVISPEDVSWEEITESMEESEEPLTESPMRGRAKFPVGWLLPNGEFLEIDVSHASTVAEYASKLTGVDFYAYTEMVDPFDVRQGSEDYQKLVSAGFPKEVLDDAWEWASQRGWIMFRDNGGTLQVNLAGPRSDPVPAQRAIKFLVASGFPEDVEFEFDGMDTTLEKIETGSASQQLDDPGQFQG